MSRKTSEESEPEPEPEAAAAEPEEQGAQRDPDTGQMLGPDGKPIEDEEK